MPFGGWERAVLPRSTAMIPAEALQRHARNRSIAATLHCHDPVPEASPLDLASARPPEARCYASVPRAPLVGVPKGCPSPVSMLWGGVGCSCPTSSVACGRAIPRLECGRLPRISCHGQVVCCATPHPLCRMPHMSPCGVCQPAVALGLHALAGRPPRTGVRVALRGGVGGRGGVWG